MKSLFRALCFFTSFIIVVGSHAHGAPKGSKKPFRVTLQNKREITFNQTIESIQLFDSIQSQKFFMRTFDGQKKINKSYTLRGLGLPERILKGWIHFAEISGSGMNTEVRPEGQYNVTASTVYSRSTHNRPARIFVTEMHWIVIHQNGEVIWGGLDPLESGFTEGLRAHFWEKTLQQKRILPFRLVTSSFGVSVLSFMDPSKDKKSDLWIPRRLVVSTTDAGANSDYDTASGQYSVLRTRAGILKTSLERGEISILHADTDAPLEAEFTSYAFEEWEEPLLANILFLGSKKEIGGIFLREGVDWIVPQANEEFFPKLNESWLPYFQDKILQKDEALGSIFRIFINKEPLAAPYAYWLSNRSLKIASDFCRIISGQGQLRKNRL